MKRRYSKLMVGVLLVGCQRNFESQTGVTDSGDDAVEGRAATSLLVSALSRPVFVTSPPDDPGRLFILEQHTGQVRIYDVRTGLLADSPFLTIDGVTTGNEEGLLGLAFAPDYATSGRFYVNFTRPSGSDAETVIARGVVSDDPHVADPDLETLMTIEQPFTNHNGGWMGFGPDGYLYVATGDGGAANDLGNRSQDREDLRGKLLRLDVSADESFTVPADNPLVGEDGDDRIWAYGLRNPWRCSFDRQSGDLYIADVGQGSVEEINIQPATRSSAVNYGWPCREGTACLGTRTGCTCDEESLVAPEYEYGHESGCSVTGGYVYRGTAIPDLQGTYFFADYCSHDILSFRYDGSEATGVTDRTEELAPGNGLSISDISSFGEDACGELYICDLLDGEVFKIVPATGSPADCNENNIGDDCDIQTGQSEDANDNGVPDECESTP